MSQKPCADIVLEYLKKANFTKVDYETLTRWQKEVQENMVGKTDAQIAEWIDKQIEQRMTQDAQRKRAADLMEAAKIQTVADGWVENQALGLKPDEFLMALFQGGALKSGDSVNLDPAHLRLEYFRQLHKIYAQLEATVSKDGKDIPLKDILESADADLEKRIFQDTDALQNGATKSASGDDVSWQIARVLKALFNKSFEMRLAKNPLMRYKLEHFFSQIHDRTKIVAVDKDVWVNWMMKEAGIKSFPMKSLEEKRVIFGEIYDQIKNDEYGSPFVSSRNTREAMAARREIEFNNWESAYRYHRSFGAGSLHDLVIKHMTKTANQLAQLEKYGTNKENYFRRAVDIVHRMSDTEGKRRIDTHAKAIRKAFDTATGKIDMPADGLVSKLTQGALMHTNMQLNGRTPLASIPDFMLQIGLLQDTTGGTIVSNARDILSHTLRGLRDDQKKIALDHLGVYHHGYMAELAQSVGTTIDNDTKIDKVLSGLRTMNDVLGVLTLMKFTSTAQRTGFASVLSKRLADMSRTNFENLPKHQQKGLKRYGLDKSWNILRNAVEEVEINGKKVKMLTPEGIDKLDDAIVANFIGKEAPSKAVLDEGRLDLSVKLGALINEHVDLGTSTATTAQRTFLLQGQDINSGWGRALRLITQFKSAAVVSADATRRRYYSGEMMKGNWQGVAANMGGLFFMGALGQYILDATVGKTPQDPRDPEFILKVFARSGAGGMFGDAVVNALEREGVDNKILGTLSALAGPVIPNVVEGTALVAESASNLATGKKLPALRGVKYAERNLIPYQNLWWLMPTLKYYAVQGFHHELNYGLAGQIRKRMRETPGLFTDSGHQEYFALDPSDR